jgi:hypothetical protein
MMKPLGAAKDSEKQQETAKDGKKQQLSALSK